MVHNEKNVEEKNPEDLFSSCVRSGFENKENIVHVDEHVPAIETPRLCESQKLDKDILEDDESRLSPLLSSSQVTFLFLNSMCLVNSVADTDDLNKTCLVTVRLRMLV